MLVDLSPVICRGIIDNTTQGTIRLLLWCIEEQRPLSLEMEGNCLSDIAGCRVEFTIMNQPSLPPDRQASLIRMAHTLHREMNLVAGDMTLSRRCRPRAPLGKYTNRLSLEFFIGARTRFLIDSADFSFSISLPEWECTRATESVQELINMSALHDHVLANVASFRGPAIAHLGDEMPPCRWDEVLNRAEAYMIITPSIHEKYMDHPHGHLAEAFVLDRQDYLEDKACEFERTAKMPATHIRDNEWDVLDFMHPHQAKRVKKAMRHPLFEATANMSGTVQRLIIENMALYKDNSRIDALLSSYSGIITHVLSTILLTQDETFPLKTATTRVNVLCLRMERLKRYGESLLPQARKDFMSKTEVLISELKNFLCTLHSN